MTGRLDLSPETSRRLRIARGSFRHGVRLHLGSPGPSTRVTALVAVDFAAEATLKAFLRQATTDDVRRLSFFDLAKRTGSRVKEFPDGEDVPLASLSEVHDKRNAAQHEARVPTYEELVATVVHVRDGLDALCAAVWEVAFDIAEADEVQTEALRSGLNKAIAARESNDDPIEAVGWVNLVVDKAMAAVAAAMAGATKRWGLRDRLPSFDRHDEMNRQLGKLVKAVERREEQVQREVAAVREAIAPLALGLDTRVWMEMRALLDQAPRRTFSGDFYRHDTEYQFTHRDAEDLTNFAVDLVLRIEEIAGGEIEPPTGYWTIE